MKWGGGKISMDDTITRQIFILASPPLLHSFTGPSQSYTDIDENFMFGDFAWAGSRPGLWTEYDLIK